MKKRLIVAGLSAALLLLIAASAHPSATTTLRMVFANAFRGPLTLVSATYNILANAVYFEPLRRENKILKDRLAALNTKLIEFGEVSRENQRLRDLLSFRGALSYTAIPAMVIGRDPTNWENTIFLNIGFDKGIKKDMVVTSPRGLVGRVVEVGKRISKVMLVTDPDSRIACITDRTRVEGVLVGSETGTCQMIYIGLEDDIKAGDKVFTSGLGGIFPKGILIGEIREIRQAHIRLYKIAGVRLSQNPFRLEEALCIK